jgi:hypothetical protein
MIKNLNNMTPIRITEIEQTFKEIFEKEEGKVVSVDSVYEKSDSGNFYKLVISIHGLSVQDTFIIHTKFIFKTDLEKKNVIEESFIYLYDINCVYHKVNFNNVLDMKKKIEDIIESNDFGEDIKILSDFIGAPSMFLNYYLKRSKITDYSVYDVIYEPKFKTQPCEETTFDFEININNNYKIDLSIQKTNRKADEEFDTYTFRFKFLDEYTTIKTDSISNIHFFIGSQIAKILDKKLK